MYSLQSITSDTLILFRLAIWYSRLNIGLIFLTITILRIFFERNKKNFLSTPYFLSTAQLGSRIILAYSELLTCKILREVIWIEESLDPNVNLQVFVIRNVI